MSYISLYQEEKHYFYQKGGILKKLFYALPLSFSLLSLAVADSSHNRELLKVDCGVNFYQQYGVEHSLLQAMAYAYFGDLDIKSSMNMASNEVGFGFHKMHLPKIEKKLGFTLEDLGNNICANYEVMAWWLVEESGYNGKNREEALRQYYYGGGGNKRGNDYAVEAVERFYKGEVF